MLRDVGSGLRSVPSSLPALGGSGTVMLLQKDPHLWEGTLWIAPREPALRHRNVQRFRGGLVFKDHRLCVSLNSRLESYKEEEEEPALRNQA